ncbi:putative disease resistance protein [Cinnamomum micranthum f. kanehirae]|uniref:Putative disease resistance protein n=1 Tax=Cinnamomum micranthum f. kanehirae TaxID=337451 RepID=A0A443PC39_9MAGN|nr:putative disease resistance protein [Cinnamomum micranthum f. kanehirae]
MEIIGSIIQIIPNLCSQFSEQTGYVRHLKENVDTLMDEARKLKALCEDIESEGREASRAQNRLTNQARAWLDQARTNLIEIDRIKLEFDQRQTFSCSCIPELMSGYTLGKRAVEKLEHVRQVLSERNVINFITMSSPRRVMEMEMPTSLVHGQSSTQATMEKIWDHLHDEHTSIICVYGMGGVGKTTLMKAINNKLQATGDFEYVIWITVSKEVNLQRIQKEIMGRLRLRFNEQDSSNDLSMKLREFLSKTRYMLILDDLWDFINLFEVGIPINKENRSKIAITTRLFEVCNDMMADAKIRANTLTEAEAWDLFAANVGEVVHHPAIEDIAKHVVMECGGLPLAIIVVSKAMQGQNKKELWQDALRALRASVPEIRGMERYVFRPLKLSYDDLKDEKVKMCFLFCSLFPEDYEIRVKRLVWLWIMEGFIENVDNLVDASNKGHRIVEMLKQRCLLEEGIQAVNFDTIKMHDVIRDLALYIASSSCNEGPRFLVKAGFGEGLKEPPPEETWREYERISLMRNGIADLPIKPECPNLVSLFLRGNPISVVPHSFFELMPTLQVLDLSDTVITSLTISPSSLLNLQSLILRGCSRLTEVPFLGQLKKLQFLDISMSSIRSLPTEMQNLVKLKKLNMSNICGNFVTTPANIISKLSSLEDLRIQKTKIDWAKGSEPTVETNATLGEVWKLKRLTTLKIFIEDFDCIEEDVFLQQWSRLEKFKILLGPSTQLTNLDCMKQLHIYRANNYPHGVEVIAAHTESLTLECANVKHISHLVGDAKILIKLYIKDCEEIECIINWSDVGENALHNINILCLDRLPKLQKLFEGEMPEGCIQRLRKINILNCEKIKSLFSSKMVQYLDQLETLYVENCKELEEIIKGDQSLPENPFPQLHYLKLGGLPKLRRIICRATLALPSLIHLDLVECPVFMLPKRPNTTNWPSNNRSGYVKWRADLQPLDHMQQ